VTTELQIGDLLLSFTEAQDALRAIRAGEVDAVVVKGEKGHQVFTFRDPSHPFRLLVECLGEGAALLTSDGLISYHNPQFAKLISNDDSLAGRSLRELVVRDDLAAVDALLERTALSSAQAEVRFARAGGDAVPVKLSVTAGWLADVPVFCLVATDLTEHRQQEELHRRARVEIEGRDRLFSIAAHELRGPLGTLTLQSQFLTMRLKASAAGEAPDTEKIVGIAEALNRQCQQMADLIGKLLDVGIIGAGRLELLLESVDFAEVVRSSIEGCAELLGRSGSEVKLDLEPVSGRWDPVRLGQVVTNLVSNAAKYGGGRPIHVSLRRVGDRGQFVVEDHGSGVPASERERIFRPFERMAATAKTAPGLGLGLYITAEIVKAHRGSVRLEDTPGGGARFVVELPLQAPD
jgi:PAS domain S-box-containing protein